MWKLFNINDLKAKVAGSEPSFFEFLRSSQMSCAVYRLPVGSKDMQAPHLEDEIYLVLEGQARVLVDTQEQEVGPGCRCAFKSDQLCALNFDQGR